MLGYPHLQFRAYRREPAARSSPRIYKQNGRDIGRLATLARVLILPPAQAANLAVGRFVLVLVLGLVLLWWWLTLLLSLRCRWWWRRTLCRPFRRPGSRRRTCCWLLSPWRGPFRGSRSIRWWLVRPRYWTIRGTLRRRGPRSWLFVRTCGGPIRWPIRGCLIWPRHRAICRTLICSWPIVWLFIRPRSWLFIRTCRGPIRRPVSRTIVWRCVRRTIIVSRWP